MANQTHHGGFTLIEAMVALSITAMAGAVLLLCTQGVLQTTNDCVDQTIAQGMAMQLIDEVMGARYSPDSDPYPTTLAPTVYERAGSGRERFNDTGDWHGLVVSPPQDYFGRPLGQGDGAGYVRHSALQASPTTFANWRQNVRVYYVNENNPRNEHPNPTNYRAVEVTIERVEPDGDIRPLARVRRVFCYVPMP
jgi:type II secretory pathway pseudopilin PulG